MGRGVLGMSVLTGVPVAVGVGQFASPIGAGARDVPPVMVGGPTNKGRDGGDNDSGDGGVLSPLSGNEGGLRRFEEQRKGEGSRSR